MSSTTVLNGIYFTRSYYGIIVSTGISTTKTFGSRTKLHRATKIVWTDFFRISNTKTKCIVMADCSTDHSAVGRKNMATEHSTEQCFKVFITHFARRKNVGIEFSYQQQAPVSIISKQTLVPLIGERSSQNSQDTSILM